MVEKKTTKLWQEFSFQGLTVTTVDRPGKGLVTLIFRTKDSEAEITYEYEDLKKLSAILGEIAYLFNTAMDNKEV